MHYFYKLFVVFFSLSFVVAEDEGLPTNLFKSLDSKALSLYPSDIFIKNEQSTDEFSSANSVDARDIPEMLDIHLDREKRAYSDVQAVILDLIKGIDVVKFSIICEGFIFKCPNLRLVSLSEGTDSLLTKDMASTLCSLMRFAPQCVVDLSETQIRNKNVFPLLKEIQGLDPKNYAAFEQRLIFLRRTYLWDAENRVKCYKTQEGNGLLTSGWIQRHKDFHRAAGLSGAKKVLPIDLPYPINLVFGVYSPDFSKNDHVLKTEEYDFKENFCKISLSNADNSSEYSDEDCDLSQHSSVDSNYLSQHIMNKYANKMANIRYVWLEDCGVDNNVLVKLRKGFLSTCCNLRVLSLISNSIGWQAAEELTNIWKTAPHCIFVLARNTFASYENAKVLFEKIKVLRPSEKDYELAIQKIILMDEEALTLGSHIAMGQRLEKEKLWPVNWKERHQDFWKIHAPKRNRILESLVSEDSCE